MKFTLTIRTSYIEIDSFSYSFDPEDEQSESMISLAEKCAAVRPGNTQEIEDLICELHDNEVAKPAWEGIALDPRESIMVSIEGKDDYTVTIIEDTEMPEAAEIVPKDVSSKFCYLKIWENSGTFRYEGDGAFEENKLSYKNGKLFYDGNEFSLIEGEGSSSYQEFYVNGKCVYRGA